MVSRLPDNMVIDLTNDSDSEDQIQSQVSYHSFYFLSFFFLSCFIEYTLLWVGCRSVTREIVQ